MKIKEEELNKISSNLSEIRNWFINKNSPNIKNELNETLWYKAVNFKNEEIIDEIILAGADLNIKSQGNNSWVIACIENNISTWLFQEGFSLLNNNWWKPNDKGTHPFYMKEINPEIMFLLCSRLRIDSISWNTLSFNNKTPESFHKDNPKVLKIILRWKNLIKNSHLPTLF